MEINQNFIENTEKEKDITACFSMVNVDESRYTDRQKEQSRIIRILLQQPYLLENFPFIPSNEDYELYKTGKATGKINDIFFDLGKYLKIHFQTDSTFFFQLYEKEDNIVFGDNLQVFFKEEEFTFADLFAAAQCIYKIHPLLESLNTQADYLLQKYCPAMSPKKKATLRFFPGNLGGNFAVEDDKPVIHIFSGMFDEFEREQLYYYPKYLKDKVGVQISAIGSLIHEKVHQRLTELLGDIQYTEDLTLYNIIHEGIATLIQLHVYRAWQQDINSNDPALSERLDTYIWNTLDTYKKSQRINKIQRRIALNKGNANSVNLVINSLETSLDESITDFNIHIFANTLSNTEKFLSYAGLGKIHHADVEKFLVDEKKYMHEKAYLTAYAAGLFDILYKLKKQFGLESLIGENGIITSIDLAACAHISADSNVFLEIVNDPRKIPGLSSHPLVAKLLEAEANENG